MTGSTNGLYMTCILEAYGENADPSAIETLCRDVGLPGLPSKLDKYPSDQFNRLIEEGGKRFWPWEPVDRLYYRHGEKAFGIFAETLLGKVGLTLGGNDIKKIAASAQKYLERAVTSGVVKYVDTGEKSCRLEYRNFLTSAHYHHGLLTTATKVLEPRARVKMKIIKQDNPSPGVFLTDVDFDIRVP